MSIRYDGLNEAVRQAMICELNLDEVNQRLYFSDRLNEEGVRRWPGILRDAFAQHDDMWIAMLLRSGRLMHTREKRHKRKGGFTLALIPHTAPDMLAEGEFNRFYARGLCANVVASGGTEVEVYRGKSVLSPRRESVALIGRRLPAQELLNDLRTSQGVEPALGLPPGPNSGLTVRGICRNPQSPAA